MAIIDRKERDKQLRKADILRAAEHIFSSKGYHDATIQDIAKEAQYGTGTVYLYFKDKNALYFSMLEEKMKNLARTVQDRVKDIKDAREKLELFIRESLTFFDQNRGFFHIYMLEKNSLQLVVGRKASESLTSVKYITDDLKELIEMAQKQGVIRKDHDTAEVADLLVAIMGSLILNWTKSGSGKTLKLASRSGFICDIFLNGVGKKIQ